MYKVKKNGYSFISLIFLLLIVLVVFNYRSVFSVIKPDLSFGKAKIKEVYDIKKDNFDSEKTVFVIKKGIIQIKDDKMYYIDNDFKTIWSKNISGKNIEIYNENNKIYVINKAIGDIFKIDYNGNIDSKIYSQGKIEKVVKYSDNKLIILREDSHIIEYDKDLNVVQDKNLKLYKLLNIKMFGNLYYILNIEDKNDIFFTRIVKLDENLEFVSNFNIKDEILYNIFFYKDFKIINSNNRIFKIDNEDEILWTVSFDYFINRLLYSDDKIYINLISEKEDDEYNYIKVLDKKGLSIKEIKSPIKNIVDMKIRDNKLYLVSNNKFCVLDEEFKILFLKEINAGIREFKFLNDNKILFDMENYVNIYQIRF